MLLLLAILMTTQTPAQEIEIKKLNISTTGNSELAPVLQDSVLYFISNRRTNLLVTYMDQNEALLYRILKAPLKAGGKPGSAKLFSPPGQPRFNAGPITFSANGSQLIATHNVKNHISHSKKQKQNNQLGLFSAINKDGAWRQYKIMELFPEASFSIGQPTLSPDSKILFFVSDMEGGHGDTDIYVSYKQGESWGEPQNLGPGVNTSGKELFPFIHASGKLYFSSDGYNGQGGFDIYHINWKNPNARPVALPSPINTIHNDYSGYIAPDENRGYFSSDRAGDDDIYQFTLPQIACPDPQEIEEDNYCFTFFENGPFKTDTLPYIYRWNFGDGQTAVGLEVDHCFPGPGDYAINLNVVDTLLNEELFSVASYNLNLKETNQIWFNVADTIKTGETINLTATIRGFDDAISQPGFYWDFDSEDNRFGKDIAYIYKRPGRYRITCSSVLNNNREVCFYKEIIVIDPQE
jgi:hypothetical protein